MQRIFALTAAAVLVVAACGDDDDTASTTLGATGTSASPDSAAASSFNEADVTFAQGMIPHHQQAVEMAELALDPAAGAGPQVVDLATRVKAAQDPEITLMTGWLEAWGAPLEPEDGMGSMGGEMEMGDTMSPEEMEALAAATGVDFDRMWVEMMIRHHQGAITMAEIEQAEGASADAVALAGQIIEAQQAEIEEMSALSAG